MQTYDKSIIGHFFRYAICIIIAIGLASPNTAKCQCAALWQDDEATWMDSEAAWVFDDIEDCQEKIAAPPMVIYPNPTTDYFEVKNAVDTEGVLYDNLGRLVKQVKLNTIIDVSNMPKGMYFIKVGQFIQKLVVN